jgi:hypothetical protein
MSGTELEAKVRHPLIHRLMHCRLANALEIATLRVILSNLYSAKKKGADPTVTCQHVALGRW